MSPIEAHALKLATQEKRRELQNKLPAVAMRVFALRGKPYQGHGYHWGMEKSIGYLLSKVNDYDSKFDHMDQMTMEILYEELLERVDTAEAE